MDSPHKSLFHRLLTPMTVWLGLLGVATAAGWFAYAWSERTGYARLDDTAARQLDLYAGVLEGELDRYAHLPSLIDVDQDVEALLRSPANEALRATANRKLARLSAKAGALLIFVVDARGIVAAASNAYRPDTPLGRNVSARPYFAPVMRGESAQFFSTDATAAPEYYFARPFRRDDRILGIVIVGISLSPMESVWVNSAFRPESEKPLVVDEHGVVIMSSVPYWKFKLATSSTDGAFPPLPDDYPATRIEPLDMAIDEALAHGAQLVRLRLAADAVPTPHVVHERPIARLGWRLLIASDPSDVRRGARQTAWAAGAGVACVGLLLLYLRQRARVTTQKLKARDELERKVQQRTAELRREIAEREHAEQVLHQAQEDLVQAGKLALVGQLAAGVSHEIGQPLTALDALAENTQLLLTRGDTTAAAENLTTITSLVQRMGRITAQLKSFVRKADTTAGPVRLNTAVENARRLIEVRLLQDSVDVHIDVAPEVLVQCDGNRLEQVLLNLMTNALDAMHDSPTRRLSIRAWRGGDRVTVCVSDTGPGIARDVRERLFEPFFTTKPPGQGLGLGLVISGNIVHEFGGALRAVDAETGAAFEFDLAIAGDKRV